MSERKNLLLDMRSNEFQKYIKEMNRSTSLVFRINQSEPNSAELRNLINELLNNKLDESSNISTPLQIDHGAHVKLGKNVFINHSLNVMSAGHVEIEDNVMIGPQVTLLTANHEFDDHYVLLVSKILIKNNAWIGARAVILPGVSVGENSVVAAGAVVSKDVCDNVVVGGNPARILKKLKEEV